MWRRGRREQGESNVSAKNELLLRCDTGQIPSRNGHMVTASAARCVHPDQTRMMIRESEPTPPVSQSVMWWVWDTSLLACCPAPPPLPSSSGFVLPPHQQRGHATVWDGVVFSEVWSLWSFLLVPLFLMILGCIKLEISSSSRG